MNNHFYLHSLKELILSAPIALIAVKHNGSIVFCNKLACDYFQYQEAELQGMQLEQLIPERNRGAHLVHLHGYFAKPEPRAMGIGRKLTALRRDGHEFPIEIGLSQITIDAEPLVIATIVDISPRRKLEQRFEQVLSRLPEGLLITSDDGKITEVNLAAQQMFGYSRNELLGLDIEILVPETARHQHVHHRASFRSMPAARRMGISKELFARRKDGSLFPVEIGLNPFDSGENLEVIISVIDISDRLKVERERQEFELKIQQTQKLESLGVLAGGIAHDFNNLLTGIVGNGDLALLRLPPGSPVMQNVENMLKSALRAAELCEQMLAYTGKNTLIRKNISLNELVTSTAELISASINKNVTLKYSLREQLPPLFGDATQIRQVLMNLVINASEAIEPGIGQITIATGLMDYDPGTVVGHVPFDSGIPPGKYLFLTVSDDGCGMDKQVLEKIFEPFYSTKFTGRGLGLAAVLGIIRSHEGSVRINSEPGLGTTFRILLPFQGSEADLELPPPQGADHKGRILIIDDEPDIHQVLRDILESEGYTCTCALDGRDGLALFETSGHDFLMVITDLTMPQVGGIEVLRKIRSSHPDLPVILMSGYSENAVREQLQDQAYSAFLHKPLRAATFLALIDRIRSGTSGTGADR